MEKRILKQLEIMMSLFEHKEGDIKGNKIKTKILKSCPDVVEKLNTTRQFIWSLEKEQQEKQNIEVVIKGGLIIDINKPDNITVTVKDYDIDGCEDNLKENEFGESYRETIWE